jgi:hypothetical protein
VLDAKECRAPSRVVLDLQDVNVPPVAAAGGVH